LNGVSAFSPDGSLLAVSLCESAVHIHDAESGDERFLLPGHVGPITDIAFSSDGKWLASSSVDGTIRVSDLTDGECKYTWDSGDNMILEIAFLGDGPDQMACLAQRRDESIAHRLDNPRRRIIGFKSSIVDGKVQVVNVAKGSPADEVGLRMGDFVMKLNGESISSMDEVIDRLRTVNLGDSVTLTIERDSQELELEMTPVPLGELFPAESLVPPRHRTNEDLYVLDVVSGEVRFTRRVSPRPLCFGGDYIAITQPLESTNDTPLPLGSASGGLQLLNWRTGDVVAALEGTHLVFSSDGAKALVWGQHGLRIIDPKSGETLKVLSEGNLFRSAAFSPDQQLVAAKAPPGVFIFDVSSGQAIGQYSHFMQSGPASQASFSSDGKFLALGTQSSSNFKRGCNVSVWNLARLQMQRRGTVVADKLGKIGRFVLSPTGEHFAAAVGKGGTSDQLSEFVIGSIATGELRTFEVPEASRYGAKIVFSRDGKLVIYGNYCEDSTTGERESFAHVYSVTAPDKEVLKNTFHSEEGDVWALPHSQIQLAVTPERTMIFLGSRRRLLDFETGEPILDFELDTRSCLSPDGKFIATWRMRPPSSVYSDGKPFEWIRPFASGPPSGFSEDNHYLLTSTGSSPRHTVSVHILDSQSGKLVSTYAPRRAQFAGRQFSFNPSGTRLAIFERESTDLAIVDVRTGRELIYVHHDEPLAGVGFHPDGNRLYTATRDGKVIMWDGTPQPVEQQTSHPPQRGGANTPSSGINPARFAEMFIARFDKDGDGKLSEEETVFWSRLAGADRDNDGKLDFDEIQSGLEEMRKNRRTEDPRE
jgi:WD40 repeat protein